MQDGISPLLCTLNFCLFLFCVALSLSLLHAGRGLGIMVMPSSLAGARGAERGIDKEGKPSLQMFRE